MCVCVNVCTYYAAERMGLCQVLYISTALQATTRLVNMGKFCVYVFDYMKTRIAHSTLLFKDFIVKGLEQDGDFVGVWAGGVGVEGEGFYGGGRHFWDSAMVWWFGW